MFNKNTLVAASCESSQSDEGYRFLALKRNLGSMISLLRSSEGPDDNQ
jgi:hypothetical protein